MFRAFARRAFNIVKTSAAGVQIPEQNGVKMFSYKAMPCLKMAISWKSAVRSGLVAGIELKVCLAVVSLGRI